MDTRAGHSEDTAAAVTRGKNASFATHGDADGHRDARDGHVRDGGTRGSGGRQLPFHYADCFFDNTSVRLGYRPSATASSITPR